MLGIYSFVPMKRKHIQDDGGKFLIDMLCGIDDYIHRRPERADLYPFTYRAIISIVRKQKLATGVTSW